MCNNNGECRKFDAEVMCPSYRVTGDEQHLTRGRANTLRLAVTGQLGPEALVSDEMWDTLDLCVACKGCKRECPTGVDMARMKIEFRHAWNKRHGLNLHQKLIAYLPRYARVAASLAPLMNLRNRLPLLRRATEAIGFSAERSLPKWRLDWFDDQEAASARSNGRDVVLFVDTFPRYFEPDNARAAAKVLTRAPRRRIAAGRCAAAVRFLPRAWSIRRKRRRGACSQRWSLTSRAESAWSGSSRRACSPSRTSIWRCCPDGTPRRLPARR
jgi:Fe-S oxidoreductase